MVSTLDVSSLVREHAAYVMRTLRHLGVRSEDLDDVAQETFLVVHRRRNDWDPARGPVRHWIYGICVQHVRHYRRALARRREVVGEHAPPAENASVEAAWDARRLAEWVLGHLDEEKRAVFVLFEIEELPMNEVVDIVGCPLKTGYSRLHAAREIVARAHRTARERGWT